MNLSRRNQAWFGSAATLKMEQIAPGEELSVEVVERMLQRASDLVGIEPRVVAVDKTEQGAFAIADDRSHMAVVTVQHHHAHYVLCMAENGLTGNVIAAVYDGGAAGISDVHWGGEILLGGREGFRRIATFRQLALPGAKAVRRQAWTVSLTLLDDAFDGEPPLHAIPMFRNLPRRGLEVVGVFESAARA